MQVSWCDTYIMKQADLSNYQKDLADSQAGLNSDLYRAVLPMVASDSETGLRGAEAARDKRLREDMRKGLVGLEYLTGIKKNTGDTFYDEHPVQAVTTDLLGKSPLLGAGLAAAGVGTNLFRQAKNQKMTEMASMARKGNPEVDISSPAQRLDPASGAVREDYARVFGDFENDAVKRFKLVDKLNNLDSTQPTSFSQRHELIDQAKKQLESKHNTDIRNLIDAHSNETNPGKAKQLKDQINLLREQHTANIATKNKELKALIDEAKKSSGYGGLHNYANLHESLQRAKEKGGLKNYIGEGLNDVQGDGFFSKLLRKLAPSRDQAIADLAEKNKVTGVHPHYDQELLNRLAEEYHGDPAKANAFARSTAKKISDPAHMSSSLRKTLGRHKLPLAAGGALALGGTGLYHLIKAIQNQVYSKDQIKDWKKTLLKSRGEFDAANQLE